jgi:FlaG/FlaF family flagellin (archaellin)
VILAAVIGTFVLGLGDQVSNTSPTASFTFDQSTADGYEDAGGDTASLKQVTITHDGGDKISESQLNISVSGDTGVTVLQTGGSTNDDGSELPFGGTGEVSAGTTVTVDAAYTGTAAGSDVGPTTIGYASGADEIDTGSFRELETGDTIRVVWSSSNGGDSATLGKTTVN